MRSSKSRSRHKNNRNRPSGNVVNRVFDSSGPEGKVRGTPQQIIDKYNQLARDAQLANDRVAAENFQQHAEHYMRMLSDAQREQDTRREEQERQNRERQVDRDRERQERMERQEREANNKPQQQPQHQPQQQQGSSDPSEAPQPDLIDTSAANAETGLVETPEAKAAEKPRTRKPRRKPARKPEGAKPADTQQTAQPAQTQQTVPTPKSDNPKSDNPEAAE